MQLKSFWAVVIAVVGVSAHSCLEPEAGWPESLPPLAIAEGCNPLASDADCMLPFPSDVFLVDDASMPSGKRVRLPESARLKGALTGQTFDFTDVHPADGWSHGTQILALFPGGVSASNLPAIQQPTAGLQGPTVLLEAESLQGVLHFAELDPRAKTDSRRALLVRPLTRLKNQTRYIVALRGLVAADGTPVPVPEGFRRIRDRQYKDDPVLEPLAIHYELHIFPALRAAGISRRDLQLAWDFTTESEANVTRDMLAVRDQTLAVMSAQAPQVTISSVEENVDVSIGRRITGTLEVPLFMTHSGPGASLFRDAQGNVAQNGTTQVPFTLQIPRSVLEGRLQGRLLQFGHGFFGSRAEADGTRDGFIRPFLEQYGFVTLTVDWWGMSNTDAPLVGQSILYNPKETLRFTDRVHQAMANQIAVTFAARTSLAQLAELHLGDALAYTRDEVYFYGISQGHILGGTYLALTPHVERGALSVGGANLSLMLFRASPFAPFLQAIAAQLPDPLDQQKFGALVQTSFDRVDPLTYAPHVLDARYDHSPSERRVMMQYGLGDALVPNVATELHARAMGLGLLQPASVQVPWLSTMQGTVDDSALVQFDFGIPSPLPGTIADLPAAPNAVHEGVRRNAEGQRQVAHFFSTGEVLEICTDATPAPNRCTATGPLN